MTEENLDLVENAPEAENPTPEVPEAEETKATEGNESSEAPSEGESEDKSELPKGIQKRFAKLTKQKHEQQAEIEALRTQLEESRKVLETFKTRGKDEFNSEAEWIDHITEQKLQKYQAEQQIRQTEDRIQSVSSESAAKVWSERVQSYAEELPDFAEVVGGVDIPMSQETLQEIIESDMGPKLAYHLAQNPDEAAYLDSLNAQGRTRFLTRLEIRLEDAKLASPKAPITKATPTPQTHGRPGNPVSPENMSMSDWMKWRNKQIGRN